MIISPVAILLKPLVGVVAMTPPLQCPNVDATGTSFPVRPPGMPAFMPVNMPPPPPPGGDGKGGVACGYTRIPGARTTILACGCLCFYNSIACVELGSVQWRGYDTFTCVCGGVRSGSIRLLPRGVHSCEQVALGMD